jgi:hypothetical protein
MRIESDERRRPGEWDTEAAAIASDPETVKAAVTIVNGASAIIDSRPEPGKLIAGSSGMLPDIAKRNGKSMHSGRSVSADAESRGTSRPLKNSLALAL